MMTMKRIYAAFVAIVVSTLAMQSQAQILSEIEGMPPYKLGATIGLNVPSFSGGPYISTVGVQTGLNLMVDGSMIAGPNTFGRVELKYSMKGAYHEKFYAPDDYIKDWYTTHYLEIPIHAGYAWYVNEMWSVMAEAGPYVAYGFSGRRKTEEMKPGKKTPVVTNEDFFSGNELDCPRFDAGFGLQFSAMYAKDIQFHVVYDFGFVNLHSSFQQNRNLSFGLTYFFE